jgi:hypothetical protein
VCSIPDNPALDFKSISKAGTINPDTFKDSARDGRNVWLIVSVGKFEGNAKRLTVMSGTNHPESS